MGLDGICWSEHRASCTMKENNEKTTTQNRFRVLETFPKCTREHLSPGPVTMLEFDAPLLFVMLSSEKNTVILRVCAALPGVLCRRSTDPGPGARLSGSCLLTAVSLNHFPTAQQCYLRLPHCIRGEKAMISRNTVWNICLL